MQFSRNEMIFNEASHVWLLSQAFSCLANRQYVHVPSQKIFSVTLLRSLKSNLFSGDFRNHLYIAIGDMKCMEHLDVL